MTRLVHDDTTTTPTGPFVAAARAVDTYKIDGKDQTDMRAPDGVSVELERGRFAAIMGPSGSGQSTLLHCIAGLDSIPLGKAHIGDADLSTRDDHHVTILPTMRSAASSSRTTSSRRCDHDVTRTAARWQVTAVNCHDGGPWHLGCAAHRDEPPDLWHWIASL